jgi:pyroglutamyl-peptidase
MSRVLVTGFDPFGGASVNPSWAAVRQLACPDVAARLLPCVFGAALDRLWGAVEDVDPDVVICTGLAGGRAEVSIERVAVNLDDARIPDNVGAQPIDQPVVPGGPAGYFATIPVKACVAAVRAVPVPAGLSLSAGTFVCNHVFYGLLHRAATRRPGRLRCGFVHVPYLPEQGEPALAVDSVAAALRAVVDTAVAVREDVPVAAGALH